MLTAEQSLLIYSGGEFQTSEPSRGSNPPNFPHVVERALTIYKGAKHSTHYSSHLGVK